MNEQNIDKLIVIRVFITYRPELRLPHGTAKKWSRELHVNTLSTGDIGKSTAYFPVSYTRLFTISINSLHYIICYQVKRSGGPCTGMIKTART